MIVVQIAGRLGKDPESRFTQSGQKVTSLTLATNVWKAGKEETVWWRVTLWGDRFDKLLPHLKKGSALIVTGEMNPPHIWTDKEGRPQVGLELTAEIVRFSPSNNPDRPQDGTAQTPYGTQNRQAPQTQQAPYGAAPQNYGHQAKSDYNDTMSGNATHYEADHVEEPVPF